VRQEGVPVSLTRWSSVPALSLFAITRAERPARGWPHPSAAEANVALAVDLTKA